MNKKTVMIILILSISQYLYSQENSDGISSDSGDYSTSVYLRYNMTRPEYANTPYMFGLDSGIDIDLGSSLPVLNLAGIGGSARYVLFNNINKFTDEVSYSHYISAGLSLYLKTRFKDAINFGTRFGTGSGWMINTEIDMETGNNKRLSGLYIDSGFFAEFKHSGNVYIETGAETRKQYYFKQETEIDPVDIGSIYIKAGLKL
jgi:hypothetical protein